MSLRTPSRRGVAIFAVMVAVAIAALTAASVLSLVDARLGATRVSLDRSQVQLLLQSGARAIVAELHQQRHELLQGREPRVTKVWSMPVDGGSRGVIRLVAWTSSSTDENAASGPVIWSEAACLDLNHATPAMLAKVPGLDEASGDRIVAQRLSSGYESVAEIVDAAGVPATLFDESPIDTESRPSSDDVPSAQPLPIGLWLTVFTAEPNLQVGIGPRGSEHAGRPRIDLSKGWSDELAHTLADRFGPEHARVIGDVVQRRGKVVNDAGAWREIVNDPAIAADAGGKGVGGTDLLASAIDALTWTPDPFVMGRIDVMRAPANVLAAVPGIDAAAAERIVGARGSLDSDQMGSIGWLLSGGDNKGVLTPEAFAEASPWLVARSLQWRVRLEAGIADPGQGDTPDATVTLRSPRQIEIVVDVAGQAPRVAYWREVTMLPLAGVLAKAATESTASTPPIRETTEPSIATPENPGPTPMELVPTNSNSPEMGPVSPKPGVAEDPNTGVDRRRGRWRVVT